MTKDFCLKIDAEGILGWLQVLLIVVSRWASNFFYNFFVSWFIMITNFYARTALSLEVKNTPETVKLLGSNLSSNCLLL